MQSKRVHEIIGVPENSDQVKFITQLLSEHAGWVYCIRSMKDDLHYMFEPLLVVDMMRLADEPRTKKEIDRLRAVIIKFLCTKYPGLVNARTEFNAVSPLELTCFWFDYTLANTLLDLGAHVTQHACDVLTRYGTSPLELALLKRLIRHGGFPANPKLEHIAYKKQFESARDGSLTLIGIRKYRRSPLIPVCVPIDIIKAIAHQIRQRHEEIDFEVSRKNIKV